MSIKLIQYQSKVNNTRFDSENGMGFYESFFIRANHPNLKKGFWIRYTLFASAQDDNDRKGELWFAYFSEEGHCVAKEEFNLSDCSFPRKYFDIRVGGSTLNSSNAKGLCLGNSWNLNYTTNSDPLFFLPLSLYKGDFPKAKSIVSQPLCVFNGRINLNGESIDIDQWRGSQNHNWGLKHTDYYAWGQVAGFDNSADTFLELITGKLKYGNLMTPFITILVLRHRGEEIEFNSPLTWFRNKGSFSYLDWNFECENNKYKVVGRIYAEQEDFVGFRYRNPVGGDKSCLNSKIARCELKIINKSSNVIPEYLICENSCAFEILTDEKEDHGIKINF